MKETVFPLRPFGGEDHPEVTLEAVCRRQEDLLMLCFLLRGHLTAVELPEAAAMPERRDRLWKQTCFELFFGRPGAPGYWEVNLSPAGHWNVYGFDDYRTNLHPADGFHMLPFSVVRQEGALALILELALHVLLPPATPLEAGLAGVLLDKNGRRSHWALAHAGGQPDFHCRDGFLARLLP